MANLIWLQGAGDNGCTMSWLNADEPDVFQIIDKLGVNVVFHPTVNPTSGPEAVAVLEPYAKGDESLDVLVVEGAPQLGPEGTGLYCLIGERAFKDIVIELAEVAGYTVAVGSCAAFGGMSAAEPNPTDATGMQFHKDKKGGLLGEAYKSKAGLPVINIPGCPAHPDWVTNTLGAVLLGKENLIKLDEYQRPKVFYDTLTHHGCPLNEYFDYKMGASKFAEEGCLFDELGCKGPMTHSDCNRRLWNRQSSKTKVGAPCIGCTEPNFPDEGAGTFFKTKKLLPYIPARLPLGLGAKAIFYVVAAGLLKMARPARLKERR